jgi:UDP-glucose 4-epimerase
LTQTAIVTGGAGFIGSHVVEAFLRDGWRVLALDDLSTGLRANVPSRSPLIELDIRRADELTALFEAERPAAVCHLGAQSSVTVSVARPTFDLEVNVAGTMNVCDAARRVGAPVVFASTGGALYGNQAPRPTPEDTTAEPLAPYGASKLAGEAYVGTWGRLFDVPNKILRLGNVYGPRQRSDGEAGVVAIFSDHLLRGRAPTVFGDGEQTRDYVHVGDVARAFLKAARSAVPGTYNIATGVERSVNELLALLQQAAGTAIDTCSSPLRSGELHQSCMSPARAAAELGWSATVPFELGLRETYEWYAGEAVSPTSPA